MLMFVLFSRSTILHAITTLAIAQHQFPANNSISNVTAAGAGLAFDAEAGLPKVPSLSPGPNVAVGCQCGYYDGSSKNVFTDSTIVYFNETETLPPKDLVAETYVHDYEKGWNTLFREAANPSNVHVSNVTNAPNATTSLELYVEGHPSTSRVHIINGASVRTVRQDMLYGSFTSLIRTPGHRQYAGSGGSTISMGLSYNLSQALTITLQDTDTPRAAYVGMLANEEFPSGPTVIPYGNMTNATWGNGTIDPWDYTEFRMDWTKDYVAFYVGSKLARKILTKDNTDLLSVPAPLYFKHWSNGNMFYSMGPPKNTTYANVGWTRMFFNSSSMTDAEHKAFDTRCDVSKSCLVSDMTLRGSKDYRPEAAKIWVQVNKPRPNRRFAIWIAVACACLTALLLIQPFVKRIVDHLKKSKDVDDLKMSPESSIEPKNTHDSHLWDSRAATLAHNTPKNQTRAPSINEATLNGDTRPNSGRATPHNHTRQPSRESKYRKDDSTGGQYRISAFNEDVPPLPKPASSVTLAALDFGGSPLKETPWHPSNSSAGVSSERLSRAETNRDSSRTDARDDMADHRAESADNIAYEKRNPFDEHNLSRAPSNDELRMGRESWQYIHDAKAPRPDGHASLSPSWPLSEKSNSRQSNRSSSQEPKGTMKEVAEGGDAPQTTADAFTNVPELKKVPKDQKDLPQAKKRVEYLAGLVALCSLLVTATHFSFTFVFADSNAGAYSHYHSETIARKTIDSFILNVLWIGPFLTTSSRFLVASYLRNGELLPVAEKTVKRIPRLMIPITAMVMLEYFLINAGATKWLEYLPSITWSDWPFTTGYTNFSNFISEVLEIMYLIPNAAPLVTFNYCTGVLWTMPIQIQGSWLCLLAVLVIREIKTPWKRFGFYAFCILNHWYALSWGSYFYVGIMLTDLDVTYKWRPWLYARPLVYYPFLTLVTCIGIGGAAINVATQWTNVNYATIEYSIHPDTITGLPIYQVGRTVYPPYFVPRLNGLAFAAGFQAMLELSSAVQWVLSRKIIVLLFPHIFTIYLFHGFIFWSLGSFLCVHLSVLGLEYWLNILIVAIVCYATLFLSLPLLTPVLEGLGIGITKDIWMDARDDPTPRMPTLYPFRRDLFLARYATPHEDSRDLYVSHIRDPEKVQDHFDPEVEAEHDPAVKGRAVGGEGDDQEHGRSANRVAHLAMGMLKETVHHHHDE